MKIIGKTPKGYIVEASESDVANLCGYYFAGASGYKRPEIGDTINVDAMYTQLYKSKSYEEDLLKASSSLRAIADSLLPIVPIVNLSVPASEE